VPMAFLTGKLAAERAGKGMGTAGRRVGSRER
jgi:hypothetical protein